MGGWANQYYGSLAVGRTRAILRARSALLTNIMKVTSHLGGKLPALRVQAFLLSSLGQKKGTWSRKWNPQTPLVKPRPSLQSAPPQIQLDCSYSTQATLRQKGPLGEPVLRVVGRTRTKGRWANQYYGSLGEPVLRAVGRTSTMGRWANPYYGGRWVNSRLSELVLRGPLAEPVLSYAPARHRARSAPCPAPAPRVPARHVCLSARSALCPLGTS